jgi:hypothetical protein
MRAKKCGYISQFKFYTSKVGNSTDKNLGERVVKGMIWTFVGTNKKVYFDGYFTSVDFVTDLKAEGVNSCVIVRGKRRKCQFYQVMLIYKWVSVQGSPPTNEVQIQAMCGVAHQHSLPI